MDEEKITANKIKEKLREINNLIKKATNKNLSIKIGTNIICEDEQITKFKNFDLSGNHLEPIFCPQFLIRITKEL